LRASRFVGCAVRDYDLLAAIQLERLTRKKGDGNAFPDACIDEALSIAGLTRQDVDSVIMSRMLFEARYCRRVPASANGSPR
jgi:predicted NodU family carbamoyl transferase